MDRHQRDFIETVQKSLGKKSTLTKAFFNSPPADMDTRLNTYKNKILADRETLLKLFIEQANLVNMEVHPIENVSEAALAIKELIKNTEPEWGSEKSVAAWAHPLIDALNLEKTLKSDGITFFTTQGAVEPDSNQRNDIRSKLIQSYIGITSADFCVAQSAALVLRNRPNQPRAVSLIPSIHVAIIHLDQIIENLEELYFRLKWDPEEQNLGLTNCMTIISGPSKTADIELVMVRGVHGPRRLIVYVITDTDL